MEITGKIIQILPLQTGQGKNGEWKKQIFVIQTEGPYPKSVCFTMWGNQVDQNPLENNMNVKVSFDAESREFNGKWYTDLKAWRVSKIDENSTQNSNNNIDEDNEYVNSQEDAIADDSTDDLPF